MRRVSKKTTVAEMVELSSMCDALEGKRGDDQRRIARVGLSWITTLLAKNTDYGSSAWKTPCLAPECDADTAIRVRMSDKVLRLANIFLRSNATEVASEAIEDTVADLGGYCLLWIARPKE